MRKTIVLLLLPALLFVTGCQGSEPTPTPSAAQPTATPAQTPGKMHSFTVEILEGPTKSVDIWLEGPTKEERTVEPTDLSQTFELAEGVYELTVRSEGYQNFALRIQIPEMDSVKAAMTKLPSRSGQGVPVNDPFEK